MMRRSEETPFQRFPEDAWAQPWCIWPSCPGALMLGCARVLTVFSSICAPTLYSPAECRCPAPGHSCSRNVGVQSPISGAQSILTRLFSHVQNSMHVMPCGSSVCKHALVNKCLLLASVCIAKRTSDGCCMKPSYPPCQVAA